MQILLFLGFIVLLVYIGLLMSKLDKFIAEGGFVAEDDKIYPVAIVLGETLIAKQVSVLLEKNMTKVLHLTEPFQVEQRHNFRYLFALSDNDVDNLVLTKIGSRVYGIEKMIALCNDRKNEKMFIQEKICYLSGKGATAERFYDFVVQSMEEET